MIKYFYFILLSLLVSCSSTGIKLVDEYYIYILQTNTMIHIT